MNIMWIIIIVIALFSITGAGGIFGTRRGNQQRRQRRSIFETLFGGNEIYEERIKNISNMLRQKTQEILSSDQRKIKLNFIDTTEYFNLYPFNSSYINLQKKLNNQKIYNEIINEQSRYTDYYIYLQNDFITQSINSMNSSLDDTTIASIVITFLEESFELFKKYFLQESIKIIYDANSDLSYEQINKLDGLFSTFENEMRQILIKILDSWFQNGSNGQQQNYNDFADFGNYQNLEKKYYKVLKTDPSASDEEIKKNYRNLAKQYHPDLNKGKDTKEEMAQLNEAYEFIKNKRGFK